MAVAQHSPSQQYLRSLRVDTTQTTRVLVRCRASSQDAVKTRLKQLERLLPGPNAAGIVKHLLSRATAAAGELRTEIAAPQLSVPNSKLQLSAGGCHPVLQLIEQRVCDPGSQPGRRKDGYKLGLVVEGGGMRGIVTGAMLMGLRDMGLTGVFDAVYGASAGAINATYFLTGQPEGLDIYTDHLAVGNRFLSLKRYWRATRGNGKDCVMDLDYLLDEVMDSIIPLDWQAVIDSPLPLKVVVSSLTTLRSETLQDFRGRADLVECLKATANVPEIVGPPRQHRGHSLVDAAVFEPLPVKAALRDGCTHVLALCSRPLSAGPAWGKYITRTLHNAIKYWVLSPPYMQEAWRVEPLRNTHQGQPLDDVLLELLRQGRAMELDAALDGCSSTRTAELEPANDGALLAAGSLMGGHVYPLIPGPAAEFPPICTNVQALQLGRQEGYSCAHQLMAAVEALQQA